MSKELDEFGINCFKKVDYEGVMPAFTLTFKDGTKLEAYADGNITGIPDDVVSLSTWIPEIVNAVRNMEEFPKESKKSVNKLLTTPLGEEEYPIIGNYGSVLKTE